MVIGAVAATKKLTCRQAILLAISGHGRNDVAQTCISALRMYVCSKMLFGTEVYHYNILTTVAR